MAADRHDQSGNGNAAARDSDAAAFQREMQGVRPLKRTGKVNLDRKPGLDERQVWGRRQRAAGVADPAAANAAQNNYVSDEYVEMVRPDAVLAFKRPGVQDGVYRKLRLGKYPLQARLDLHRKTVRQARREVFEFVRECHQHDLRCLLILHGKGERDPERQAVLKSYTAKWLQEIDEVLAFHSAQQHHGGLGAVYVLLRKSERMKEQAREQHGRRGQA